MDTRDCGPGTNNPALKILSDLRKTCTSDLPYTDAAHKRLEKMAADEIERLLK